MKQEELDIILENHEKWLRDEGGERADLRCADLSNANLSNADLSNADLSGADLSGAGLIGADLREVNLSYANLRHADLSNADLSNADLSNADLREADLREADLREVNLSYADLNWVNWQDVRGLTVVAVQVDTTRKNNQITYIKELDIWTTGCFQGTLNELKAAVEKTHRHDEKLKERYYRVINFILNEVAE
ncbi:pentapeptide repeat-containing protein [Listeria monocytogenes]|nr:pentapeptide repeat-containing protein [Listeria monocytogenes]